MCFQGRRLTSLLLLVGFLFVAACAAQKVTYSVPEGATVHLVSVRVSNFKFEPNEIVTSPGVVLKFMLENTASVDHNLTVEDSKGAHLIERELPSGSITSEELRLTEPGEYRIYCDKPFHSSFGMTGRIVVKSPR